MDNFNNKIGIKGVSSTYSKLVGGYSETSDEVVRRYDDLIKIQQDKLTPLKADKLQYETDLSNANVFIDAKKTVYSAKVLKLNAANDWIRGWYSSMCQNGLSVAAYWHSPLVTNTGASVLKEVTDMLGSESYRGAEFKYPQSKGEGTCWPQRDKIRLYPHWNFRFAGESQTEADIQNNWYANTVILAEQLKIKLNNKKIAEDNLTLVNPKIGLIEGLIFELKRDKTIDVNKALTLEQEQLKSDPEFVLAQQKLEAEKEASKQKQKFVGIALGTLLIIGVLYALVSMNIIKTK